MSLKHVKFKWIQSTLKLFLKALKCLDTFIRGVIWVCVPFCFWWLCVMHVPLQGSNGGCMEHILLAATSPIAIRNGQYQLPWKNPSVSLLSCPQLKGSHSVLEQRVLNLLNNLCLQKPPLKLNVLHRQQYCIAPQNHLPLTHWKAIICFWVKIRINPWSKLQQAGTYMHLVQTDKINSCRTQTLHTGTSLCLRCRGNCSIRLSWNFMCLFGALI